MSGSEGRGRAAREGLHIIQDKYKVLRRGSSFAGLCMKVVRVAFICPSMTAADVHQSAEWATMTARGFCESAFSPRALNSAPQTAQTGHRGKGERTTTAAA